MRSHRDTALNPHAHRSTPRAWHAPRALFLALVLVVMGAAVPPGAAAAGSGRTLIDGWRATHDVAVVQEDSTRPAWSGTWDGRRHDTYLGNRARSSGRDGASTTLTFRGTAIAWVGAVGPQRGKARVFIDGVAVKVVDTRADRFKGGRVLFTRTWDTAGDHTIRIVNLGTAGRPRVALDAFVVRGDALPSGGGGGGTPTPTPGPTSAPSPTPTPGSSQWNLIFEDDFSANVSEGNWPAAVSSRWWAYGPGWSDTSGRGTYTPGIISQHDGLLDVHIRTENGKHKVAAFVPKLPSGGSDQVYGRYAVRFRADSMRGYKAAWMLWPKSDVWPGEGEVDFPEGDFNETIWAFMHRKGATSGSDQDYFRTDEPFNEWHTAIIEWSPSAIVFILDGVEIGRSTSRLPNTPFHWVFQNETSLDTAPSDSVSGHVLIDWVKIWSYDP